ncbi:MAG: hypothetical protein CVU43_00095 [Chloroflexi bacterium HGW-Chloroflexi-5]|jgi:hypothetical protein|nr:MAG: hypothetical protein CVU43_00095 [Chloroflexi bacterium HGW-Chloroflexi-5]
MPKMGRYNSSEISLNRIVSAIKSRLKDIPHTISWHKDPFAQNNRESIQQFKGIHAGERCFIVANGPSLKKTNLELLNNEFTFGLNRIYLNFPKSSFRPTYYVAVNELILEQFNHEISDLKMPKFINWNQRSHFNLLTENTFCLKPKLVFKDVFQQDVSKPMVFGATVTYAALQLAYYMGFQKVILIGLDHNYTEKGTPNSTEVRKNDLDESHFDNQYFPKGIKWQLPDLMRADLDYSIARKAFERDRREIVDATIGGKCSVFPKVDYLSLF